MTLHSFSTQYNTEQYYTPDNLPSYLQTNIIVQISIRAARVQIDKSWTELTVAKRVKEWLETETGAHSLCIDLFVFIFVYFVCFCFILHCCCIIVNMVVWTWWD